MERILNRKGRKEKSAKLAKKVAVGKRLIVDESALLIRADVEQGGLGFRVFP